MIICRPPHPLARFPDGFRSVPPSSTWSHSHPYPDASQTSSIFLLLGQIQLFFSHGSPLLATARVRPHQRGAAHSPKPSITSQNLALIAPRSCKGGGKFLSTLNFKDGKHCPSLSGAQEASRAQQNAHPGLIPPWIPHPSFHPSSTGTDTNKELVNEINE